MGGEATNKQRTDSERRSEPLRLKTEYWTSWGDKQTTDSRDFNTEDVILNWGYGKKQKGHGKKKYSGVQPP